MNTKTYCETYDCLLKLRELAHSSTVKELAQEFLHYAEELFKVIDKPLLMTADDLKLAENYPELYTDEELIEVQEKLQSDYINNQIYDARNDNLS